MADVSDSMVLAVALAVVELRGSIISTSNPKVQLEIMLNQYRRR